VILALFAIAFFAIGFKTRRWWTLTIPVELGVLYLLFTTHPGASWFGDTPVPFLVVLGIAATAAGVFLSRERVRHQEMPGPGEGHH
jgi:uncharacterized membrane protein HdeD (DUF308 family)